MTVLALPSPIPLPSPLQRRVDGLASAFLHPAGGVQANFGAPFGEAALAGPDSVSWRVFKNPVSLFIGGVAAVILELAEPRVRSGVWQHSSFRTDPVRRLQRTGLAAMVTVYGARSAAERMIAGIGRMHNRIEGRTPGGETYRATDPGLLAWVHATASFGFAEAYSRYVHALDGAEMDRFCAEGLPASRLYGAVDAPATRAGLDALLLATQGRLEASPIIFEFLDMMRSAPIAPAPLRPIQRLLVRAAVEITPERVRDTLGLASGFGLRRGERGLVRKLGGLADRIVLRSSPAVQSCLRLGLPADYLYRR